MDSRSKLQMNLFSYKKSVTVTQTTLFFQFTHLKSSSYIEETKTLESTLG